MKKLWLAMSVSALCAANVHASEWGYEGAHGPEHWGAVSPVCAAGVNQSPVNIDDAVEAQLAPLAVHYAGVVTSLTNNGHTLQASVSGNNTLSLDSKTFTLQQFHFHTPSENLIKGHQYPLEAHFVNADAEGNLAVLAVMFEVGKENSALSQLTQTLPKKGQSQLLSNAFPVNDLIPRLNDYYRFNGSLTTPPCSEGVRWFVLKQPQVLSAQQDQSLMQVMGHNNRPVQPHHARVILSN
ncbi:carbonic anhydrase [Vibrio fluvialis]|nr:carbonic anhydrase [Vibrio fluvialis]EKO3379364.1 carbonic anhydrase [Vibrio fluvialis]MBY8179538.1 carbonic anhydrase [Vibrio fluvialis]